MPDEEIPRKQTRAPGERSRARIVEQAAQLATIEGIEGLPSDALPMPPASPRAASTPSLAPRKNSSWRRSTRRGTASSPRSSRPPCRDLARAPAPACTL